MPLPAAEAGDRACAGASHADNAGAYTQPLALPSAGHFMRWLRRTQRCGWWQAARLASSARLTLLQRNKGRSAGGCAVWLELGSPPRPPTSGILPSGTAGTSVACLCCLESSVHHAGGLTAIGCTAAVLTATGPRVRQAG
eukprot:356052-Chlamydomonas_euryale.AAC.4